MQNYSENEDSVDNNDLIDDCNCHISDLNELNNKHLYPLLHEIVEKNYFRFSFNKMAAIRARRSLILHPDRRRPRQVAVLLLHADVVIVLPRR